MRDRQINQSAATDLPATRNPDWLKSAIGQVVGWYLPIAALIGAIGLSHPLKTMIWVAALTWMGIACLVNAKRCGRTHCFYTGPFFLLIAGLALMHGFQIPWLGTEGWRWLGISLAIGTSLLWCLPEHIQGKYLGMKKNNQHFEAH